MMIMVIIIVIIMITTMMMIMQQGEHLPHPNSVYRLWLVLQAFVGVPSIQDHCYHRRHDSYRYRYHHFFIVMIHHYQSTFEELELSVFKII